MASRQFLATIIPIVRPDFDTDNGKVRPELNDYRYVPLHKLRGRWSILDMISQDSRRELGAFANMLEQAKGVRRRGTRYRHPVAVRRAEFAHGTQEIFDFTGEW